MHHSMKDASNYIFLLLCMTITACGGGGSGGSSPPSTQTKSQDQEKPALTITQPTTESNYTSNTSTITIGGTVSDNTVVAELTWENDRGSTGSITINDNWNYSNISLQPGMNNITITAKDGDGNTSTQSLAVNYAFSDTQSPTIRITSPTSQTSHQTDINRISIAGEATDNFEVSEVRWKTDTGRSGTALGTNPWIVNDVPLTAGPTTITVTAYDESNNSSSDAITVNYQIAAEAESCMTCHNGSNNNDYAGTGLSNPHPFSGAQNIRCTVCHGGNGQESNKDLAHVPPPPQIGDDLNQTLDPVAYFNRLTLTGIDKFPDYTVGGSTYSSLDYLQFINPGDLRVVSDDRSCARCHGSKHVAWILKSPLATETGIFSGATYSAGIDNAIPGHAGLYQDTAADLAFRAVSDPEFDPRNSDIGAVGSLLEFPVISQFGKSGAIQLYNNTSLYQAAALNNDLFTINEDNGQNTNRVRANSALANLYKEQIAFTCGDCHLGSAGANNRYGDFRSSGCTACHMQYSLDGKSRSTDPNVNKAEPVNPDQIVAPERPHIARHIIQNVAKTLPSGQFVTGIQDSACAGCHQGSNRTVMQYWGIRLDQNQDVTNNTQYPANPQTFQNTATDTRLFDRAVNNNTFNGRNANQYLAFEDYDGDGRDDTPPDVHMEAGLGCIDCHGSRDLHGGAISDPSGGDIQSRHEQVVAISCESCHGSINVYAQTVPCQTYEDRKAECAVDKEGNPLRHVTREDGTGNFFLISRLNGQRHYIPQTRDTIIPSNKTNPLNNHQIYNQLASYAMGRADGNLTTGIGPMQATAGIVSPGFSHTDSMDCVSCHASWTNSCIGCHLGGAYDGNPVNYRFSNITGERIVFNQTNADFVYQTPVMFQLGVTTDNMISQMTPAEKVFFRYTDIAGNESDVFAFTDRNGNGNNPGIGGRNAFPALGHNTMMSHSIRGKVTNSNEGPRYCVACHLNQASLANFGDEYDQFRQAMATNNFANLDFNLLQQHIGKNPGNQINSPLWVHMVAGLGSGLFLFDQTGCPVNPLDNNANRQYCPQGAPANNFDVNNVVYNLDRIVEATGISNASNSSPMKEPGTGTQKRGGSLNPNLAGPLGSLLIQKLTDPNQGVVLDSWIDADGQPQGHAGDFLQ